MACDCRRLEREKGISAFLRPLEARQGTAPAAGITATLHVEGMDQAGIVYKISQFLADQGINIVDLKSVVQASPESGAAIYRMNITVQIPAGTMLDRVESGLTSVAQELHVEISPDQIIGQRFFPFSSLALSMSPKVPIDAAGAV